MLNTPTIWGVFARVVCDEGPVVDGALGLNDRRPIINASLWHTIVISGHNILNFEPM